MATAPAFGFVPLPDCAADDVAAGLDRLPDWASALVDNSVANATVVANITNMRVLDVRDFE